MPNYVAYLELVKKIEAELKEVEARRNDLLAAKQVIVSYTHGPALTLGDLDEKVAKLAEVATTKVGPTEAVTETLRVFAGKPVTRVQVIEQAMGRVSTPPDRARKVLDQTIRNMIAAHKIVRDANGDMALAG